MNVDDNIGLVYHTIKRYKLYNPDSGVEYDELVNEGVIALIKAIKAYDSSKGEFSTYAVTMIRFEILKYYRLQNGKGFHGYRTAYTKAIPLQTASIEVCYTLTAKDIFEDLVTTVSLTETLKRLPKKYAPAIEYILRKANGEDINQTTIAKKYGISQVQVSRLCNKIKEML